MELDLHILRTLPTFFFRPGRLTVEYLEGRRRRYIRPFRLYLFSSFLLFTVLALSNLYAWSPPPRLSSTADPQSQHDVLGATQDDPRAEAASGRLGPAARSGPVGDSTAGEGVHGDVASGGPGREELDAVLASLNHAEKEGARLSVWGVPPALWTSAEGRAGAPSTVQGKILQAAQDPAAVVQGMIDRAPYLMFLLVPTFALLLKLLYLRRRRLYIEHLIFTLHVHALAFLVLTVSVLLGTFEVGTAVRAEQWVAAGPVVYLVLALRQVYGQSWSVVVGKTFALLLAYGLLLAGTVVGLAVFTVALS
ncbi:MAG: DUF3667 domain-containing protein [Salinibacter sp.]